MMTPASKIVFVYPTDTLGECTVIMSEVKVRSLPVLVEGTNEFIGCLTLKGALQPQHVLTP